MLKLVPIVLALAAGGPGSGSEQAIVTEAQAFMAGYARDLKAGDRQGIAARYSRNGAYSLAG